METEAVESPTAPTEQIQDANKTESAENFQKFIYELFDKNGILNDLRAYLRGHIVNVLKNSQTDNPPSCQKHFTQRLDPTFQALNMLVAEYLLCMEFSYSLSVFVSEIPLANMLFGFAASLMNLGADGEASGLRFKDNDIWSILNYLGVKCDSQNANNVVEMYKKHKDSPLLLCILKCIQLCNMEPIYPANSLEGSITSSSKISEAEMQPRIPHDAQDKCRHYAFCQTCHVRFSQLRDKYRKKKKHFSNNDKQHSVNPLNVESFMKKMGYMEQNLIDEMFDQLKSVYEAEMDMVRMEQEDKLKRSLANHAIHFQERQNKLEESFKAREVALEGNIEHKKRFLWGLAKALRRQHSQMSKAMQAVRVETDRLANKEQSLKSQLTEAEQSLKKRGEEMRKQIADELVILERHLECMKSERDTLNRDRFELDSSKFDCETNNVKINNTDANIDLKSHYDMLKDELATLKEYLENSKLEPKCVVERSTITDMSNVNSRISVVMNNEADLNSAREVKPNKVVNDLKKQKNVNFSQSNVESKRPRSRSRSRSSSSGGADLTRLAEENDQLRRLATQQCAHISEISARAARLHAALRARRPRTAPAAVAPHCFAQNSLNAGASVNAHGWRKGAGEELSFSLGRAPIVLPGDSIPFVGVVGPARVERWRLMTQMRALRRRASPVGARRAGAARRQDNNGINISRPSSAHQEIEEDPPREEVYTLQATRSNVRPKTVTVNEPQKPREKSPKSVLREAKERLKTVPRSSTTREKSPSAMLREAKMRLRKLEIEAEAVERSYMDFRLRRELRNTDAEEDANLARTVNNLDPLYREARAEQSQPQTRERGSNDFKKIDLDKYLTKYQTNFDIGQSHFKNRNTAAEIQKPIPESYSENNADRETATKHDYLDKPLQEFRQLYYAQIVRQPENSETLPNMLDQDEPSSPELTGKVFKEGRAEIKKVNHDKKKELEILQENISKIYNLQDEPTKETAENPTDSDEKRDVNENNLLRVEIENVCELNDSKEGSDKNLLLVVSSVDQTDIAVSGSQSHQDMLTTQMTIIVSPKRIDRSDATEQRADKSRRSLSPEQQARLTRNDVFNAIFEAGDQDPSSNEMQLELGTDQNSVYGAEDYADDFSADVDNYNSKSEYDRGVNSPLSLPKTSEDENYWD